jgi:hypothetical protein
MYEILDIDKRSKHIKDFTLINEWENLTALSNRRLSVRGIDTPIRLGWSIDRITIVGKVKKFTWIRENLEPIELDFNQVWMVFTEQGVAEAVGQGWVLKDKYGENIAYAELVKFDKTKGRIDFNPSKIRPFLHGELKRFIHNLFDEPHFSRADVACDIIDIPDDFIRQYRIVDPVSFKPIYGANGELETAYWGSRASERQVRMYNKKLEQTKKRKIVPKDIETWWRLEVQLRRDKAMNWHNIMNESLNSFSSPNYFPNEIKAMDRLVIIGLFSEPMMWGEISRPTKYKYRNMLKEIAQNDELTQHLKSSFSESAQQLKDELDSWLLGLDVTDD